MHVNTEGSFNRELLESIFRTSKKTIQEYVREIERNNRYKSCLLYTSNNQAVALNQNQEKGNLNN